MSGAPGEPRSDRPAEPAATERTGEPAAERREPVAETRREPVAEDRDARYDAYGGFNFGAGFLGWLTAIGAAVLLTALLSAAGAAIQLTEAEGALENVDAETVSLVGGILLLVVLAVSYFAGGYVAGRMSRFDGVKQGVGVWVIGFVAALIIAALTALAGAEWNVYANLDQPRIPIDEGTLTTGGVIALVLALAVTFLAAAVGGKVGRDYHDRVDRAGYRD